MERSNEREAAEFGSGSPAGAHRARLPSRSSSSLTPELRKAADELAARVANGETPTADDALRMRLLGALDAIKSGRPTVRLRGLAMLEEICRGQAGISPAGEAGLATRPVYDP